MPTKAECQKILSNLGWLFGVSPRLIATRLLSEDDKRDMLNAELPMDTLECAVRVWIENKMPDYANGHRSPYKP